MVVKMYSLLDGKGKVYSKPFYANNDGEALRSFAEAVNNKDLVCGKYPEDFSLFRVGEWDDNTGMLSPADIIPVYIAKAIDFVKVDVVKVPN